MGEAIAVKERPILMSGPMVRAILDGRKTQTRRTLKFQANVSPDWEVRTTGDYVVAHAKADKSDAGSYGGIARLSACPYGQPGDRLWVRETAAINDTCSPSKRYHFQAEITYQADGAKRLVDADLDHWRTTHENFAGKFSPSIHMPRWASRITLEITGVKVERLQDITRDDAFAEGVDRVDPYESNPELPPGMPACFRNYSREGGWFAADPIASYRTLWGQINGKTHPWKSNPWVWRIDFRRTTP